MYVRIPEQAAVVAAASNLFVELLKCQNPGGVCETALVTLVIRDTVEFCVCVTFEGIDR